MPVASQVLEWLLDSDPVLRWQVERDLARAPEEVWQATRARAGLEGYGAQLLALQDPDGQWAGGAYFPRDFDFGQMETVGQPWTATTWSLNALREWGLDASLLGDTADRLAANSRWEYDDLPYWGGEVDCCINGFTLANGGWLGVDVSPLVTWFAEHQLPDGGWNCDWVEGSTRSSFHSTLNALKGLLEYDAAGTGPLRAPAEEYLLERGLFRKLSTGEVAGPWATHFAYPFRWIYSVLNAAEYFRAAGRPDPRIGDAIELIRAARQPDGRWLQQGRHGGAAWFEVDAPVGEPSRWLTFHALRVLEWWDASGLG
jgi:hypothetical protein